MAESTTLRGDSIVVFPAGFSILNVVVFKPDHATCQLLKDVRPGKDLGVLRLVDKWDMQGDDGERLEDIHTGGPYNQVVDVIFTERKADSIILVVKTRW